MRSPLVCFLTPTIGRPSLTRSVDSLLAQTDDDWRCVVVGDGILPEIWESQFHVVSQRKIGSAGMLRNMAWVEAVHRWNPRWIAFLDDDDVLTPDYVARLREADDDEHDVVIFRMKHPSLGILPDPEAPRIQWGQVGISYAIRAHWHHRVKFINEDLANPGPEGNEDIKMLRDLTSQGAAVLLSPHLTYIVRP